MWVLQSNLVKESQVRPFAEAFRAQGITFVDVAIVPFSDGFVDEPSIPADAYVIPYGSTTLMRIALQRGWEGLFYCDQFQVPVWLIHRSDMLNDDAVIVTDKEARHRFQHANPGPWFVRPTLDFKAFSGTVGSGKELAKLMEGGEGSKFNFTDDTLVAISEAKPILCEWRYFIVGGEVISGSLYRGAGESYIKRVDDADELRAAQMMADIWLPHPTCVMDVALTDAGRRVIEFNCLNASGIYDHDVPAIVKAVQCSTPRP